MSRATPRWCATTLDFAARELLVGGAAFAATLDADTDGEEGATYVWRADEVVAALGPDAPLFKAAYGVTPHGNWEGADDPVAGA